MNSKKKNNMMQKLFIAFFACLLALTVHGAWSAKVQIDGSIDLLADEKLVLQLSGGIYRPGWIARPPKVNLDEALTGRITGTFGVRGSTEPLVNYEMHYEQSGSQALTLRFCFTPQEETPVHAFKVSFSLPAPFFAGHEYRFDNGLHGTFPLLQTEKIQLAGLGAPKSLTIASTIGEIRFEFDGRSSVLLQDNRRWGSSGYELRCSCSMANTTALNGGIRTYHKGETYACQLTLRLPEALTLKSPRPVVIQASDTWIPLSIPLEIEAGSVLDFSSVLPHDAPAGCRGRVKAVGQNFEYEGLPGIPQRFYGINLCMEAHNLTHEQSDILAERLARFGYNAVRFHHHENCLTGYNRQDSCQLDAERMERFDYLFAALKKRGIYMTTDVYVSRNVLASEIYPGEEGLVGMTEFKELCAVNRNAMESWKRFARAFLGHVNPYTGMTLAQDPALAFISMVNEGNITGNASANFQKRYDEQWLAAWQQWLDRNFPTDESREGTGIPAGSATGLPRTTAAYAHFLYDTHQRMYEEMRTFLRDDLGCQALLTDMNFSGRSLWAQSARASFDYVDHHFYIDHPRFLQKSWQLPSICNNESVIKNAAIGGADCASIRFLDRPFTISEWNYAGPGRYRGIGGILTGCLASIQNWSGLWRFAYSHNNDMFLAGKRSAGYFDVVCDPLAQVTERALLCLFLRRDLPEAPHTIAMTLDDGWRNRPDAKDLDFSPSWNGFTLLAKTGTYVASADAAVPAEASVELSLNAPKAARSIPWSEANSKSIQALFDAAKWIPDGNRTDLAHCIFQSADNSFTIDGSRNAMVLDTAMTAGGFAEAGDAITTTAATFNIRNADATVWITSVTQEPIRTSRRLLLSHVTELHNSGQKYAEEEMRTTLAWGTTPYLVRNGAVDVVLKVERPEELRVYPVDFAGRRIGDALPVTCADGDTLAFTIRICQDKHAQLLYELVRETPQSRD